MRFGLLLVLCLTFAISARSQTCPTPVSVGIPEAKEPQTVKGRLIFHDGLRKWFELKLGQPVCGATSLQMIDRSERLAKLRGCRVSTKGIIRESTTGYYSLDLYLAVHAIKPVGVCALQERFPNFDNLRPSRDIRQYRVRMELDYVSEDHPIHFEVTSGQRKLEPWQAYASYYLTGGFVLYGECGRGFAVETVGGTEEAKPSHFGEAGEVDDRAAFDPESAASVGKTHLNLEYPCLRVHARSVR